MNVKIIKTNEVKDLEYSVALRLLEQGEAVLTEAKSEGQTSTKKKA